MSRLTILFFLLSLFPLAMLLAAKEPRPLLGEIPTIDYCNLIHNPNAFREKVIRVHAKYRVGAKWSNLYSPYCGGPSEIWVNFDETYFNDSFQPCQKTNIAEKVKFKGFDQVFDMVLVGKFYGSGEPNYGYDRSRFMFVVGCVEQATVVESSEIKVPTVMYCDLVQNASRYNERVVRVQGLYSSGFEASYLRGSECKNELTWVEFDELYKTCTSKEVNEALDNLMRLNPESLTERKRASVVFLGYFEVSPTYRLLNDYPRDGFGHLGRYKNQFTVKCLEHAAALPAKYAGKSLNQKPRH